MISLLQVSLLVMLQLGDTTRTFPPVQGQNLEGRTFELPRDFAGALNVVFIAFKREQQADVDSWGAALNSLRKRHAELRVYELPTLGRRYRLIRPIIDGGMRRGIPDSTVRAATITLYIDKGPFKRALGITTEDHIEVLLVDGRGNVRWRCSGPMTQSLATELEEAVGR